MRNKLLAKLELNLIRNIKQNQNKIVRWGQEKREGEEEERETERLIKVLFVFGNYSKNSPYCPQQNVRFVTH